MDFACLAPAVIVHGAADVSLALRSRARITLVSAPGAALYAGALWWRELAAWARQQAPRLIAADILDCADASGRALAALSLGQRWLVLAADAPGRDRIAAIASQHGAGLLDHPPPALDLAAPGAGFRLAAWLQMDKPPTG